MKEKLTKFKTWIATIIKHIKWFFIDIYGFVRSCFVVPFKSIRKARFFYGFAHYWFAQRYAERRDKGWKKEWDQLGKVQGLFPIETKETPQFLVCSQLEVKYFQKKGLVNKNISYRKMFRSQNYYKSKNTYKNGNHSKNS